MSEIKCYTCKHQKKMMPEGKEPPECEMCNEFFIRYEPVEKDPPTPEEMLEDMKKIFSSGDDIEKNHKAADDLMMEVLTSLGYGEAVREFDAYERWYS